VPASRTASAMTTHPRIPFGRHVATRKYRAEAKPGGHGDALDRILSMCSSNKHHQRLAHAEPGTPRSG
jgi:hypothetical protein